MIATWYKKLSIAGKLQLLLMAAAIGGIVLFICSYSYYGYTAQTKNLLHETDNNAMLLSARLGTALQFGNADFVNQKLEIFKDNPTYYKVCVYDVNGHAFAAFPIGSNCATLKALWNGAFKETEVNGPRYIETTKNVFVSKELVGAVVLTRSKQELYDYLLSQISIMALVALVCLSICYLGTNFLQKFISAPIREISQSANKIVSSNDFTGRLNASSSDELGKIVESFNKALILMDQRYQTLATRYLSTHAAYQGAIKKMDHLSEEFTNSMETFLVYQKMTSEEMMGNDIKRYQHYCKDVFDSLCFYHITMDSLKQLTNLYSDAINSPKTKIHIGEYITSFSANLAEALPFVTVDCHSSLASNVDILLVHKSAWDEIFTLLRNLYHLISGVVTFSTRIAFTLSADDKTLIATFGEQCVPGNDNRPSVKKTWRSFKPQFDIEEEDSYIPNSIEDPNVADDFLDDEILQRQDLKYILDSIAYIANANNINVMHHFGKRNLVIQIALEQQEVVNLEEALLVLN